MSADFCQASSPVALEAQEIKKFINEIARDNSLTTCDLVRLVQGFDFELFFSPQLEVRRLALAVASFLLSTLDLKAQELVMQKDHSTSEDRKRPEAVRVAGPFVRSGTLTFLSFDSSIDTSASSKYMYSAQSKQDRKLFSYLLKRLKDNFTMIIGVGYDKLNDILQHHRLLDTLPDIKHSTVFLETRSLGSLVDLKSANYEDWRTQFMKAYPHQDPRIKHINRLLSKRSVIALPPMCIALESCPSLPKRQLTQPQKEEDNLLLSFEFKKSSTCVDAPQQPPSSGRLLFKQKTAANTTLSTSASKSPRGRGDKSELQDRLSPKTPTRSTSKSYVGLAGSLALQNSKHQIRTAEKNPNFRLSRKSLTGPQHQSADKPQAPPPLGSRSIKLGLKRPGTRIASHLTTLGEKETLLPQTLVSKQPEPSVADHHVKEKNSFFCKVRKVPKCLSQAPTAGLIAPV